MDEKIIKNRVNSIRKTLFQKKFDCHIITKPSNVTYATGFSGDNSWALVTHNKDFFLTDSRYTEQAKSECCGCKIIERTNTLPKLAAKIINRSASLKNISIEDSTSIAAFGAVKKLLKNKKLKPGGKTIEPLREVKNSREIKNIEIAADIAANALKKAVKFIKPGITENQLAGRLDFIIRQAGSVNAFDTIVAFGANASMPHHRPTDKALKKNDTVLIDFGAKYNGYCCDITRCFTIGKVSSFYKKVYNAVRQAQTAAIDTIKEGVEITKVDQAARSVLKKHNLPVYGHGTGHGFGLEVHESPLLIQNNKTKLVSGNVTTIEPAVYIPGKLGIRIEDDILVTETGCQILTGNCNSKYNL